ncbi:hypothetical protein QZH41_003675 [Actinostola sp. cb2023]|nr:hypothetical protein QZH41_003675 [Actinostola sp. cb2023]
MGGTRAVRDRNTSNMDPVVLRAMPVSDLRDLCRQNGIISTGQRGTLEGRLTSLGPVLSGDANSVEYSRDASSEQLDNQDNTGTQERPQLDSSTFNQVQMNEIKRIVKESITAASREIAGEAARAAVSAMQVQTTGPSNPNSNSAINANAIDVTDAIVRDVSAADNTRSEIYAAPFQDPLPSNYVKDIQSGSAPGGKGPSFAERARKKHRSELHKAKDMGEEMFGNASNGLLVDPTSSHKPKDKKKGRSKTNSRKTATTSAATSQPMPVPGQVPIIRTSQPMPVPGQVPIIRTSQPMPVPGQVPIIRTSQPMPVPGQVPIIRTSQPMPVPGQVPIIRTSQPMPVPGQVPIIGTSQPMPVPGQVPIIRTSQPMPVPGQVPIIRTSQPMPVPGQVPIIRTSQPMPVPGQVPIIRTYQPMPVPGQVPIIRTYKPMPVPGQVPIIRTSQPMPVPGQVPIIRTYKPMPVPGQVPIIRTSQPMPVPGQVPIIRTYKPMPVPGQVPIISSNQFPFNSYSQSFSVPNGYQQTAQTQSSLQYGFLGQEGLHAGLSPTWNSRPSLLAIFKMADAREKTLVTAGHVSPRFLEVDNQDTLTCQSLNECEQNIADILGPEAINGISGGIDTFAKGNSTSSNITKS